MLMLCLERRLKQTNVSVYSIHNGAIDALIKTNNKDLTTWGTIYSIGRSLGELATAQLTTWGTIYSIGRSLGEFTVA